MYPVIRLLHAIRKARSQAALGIGETHVSHHICWPWDLDVWMELNNGRTLTLYDLGRFGMFQRLGIIPTLRRNGWTGTVAGASVRYRRRVRGFDRIEMRARIIGWDHRFLYSEQSMWHRADCTSHILLRLGVTDRNGLIPPPRVAQDMGLDPQSPPLPEWVAAWIAAEAQRPWPPMDDAARLG